MLTFKQVTRVLLPAVMLMLMSGCSDDDDNGMSGSNVLDPNTAPKASVDRFSPAAGHLMVRDGTNGLPAANAPVNFDQAPFVTRGLRPEGGAVEYYNFDVQPMQPAPIYVLIRTGESTPVAGQLNIVDVKPGDAGYNDFWQVHMVTVPADYVANTIHSKQQIMDGGYSVQQTTTLVNCPIVPEGSTASRRVGGGATGLNRGWYKDQVVFYFTFEERALTTNMMGQVPTSPILVCFNINPDQSGGGPASGFKVEMGSEQTHNVVATLPADSPYSPLWAVSAYDMAGFTGVMDWATAAAVMPNWDLMATVNCPVVALP